MLIPRERVLTVVGAGHDEVFADHLTERRMGTVLTQPANRETAPGTLLPLAHVLHADPGAVVGVFPSDHFVLEENRFMAHVWAASNAVRRGPYDVVVLGASASRADPDYGWIDVEHAPEVTGALGVRRFWEKPTAETAAILFSAGHLWSTMVVVASAAALWELICEAQPVLRQPFERIKDALGTVDAGEVLEREYLALPEVSLSCGVFQRLASRLGAMILLGVYWSDWGREERIRETSQHLRLSFSRQRPLVGPPGTSPEVESEHPRGTDESRLLLPQGVRRSQRRPS